MYNTCTFSVSVKSLHDSEMYFNFSTRQFSKSLNDSEMYFNFSTRRFSKSMHNSEIVVQYILILVASDSCILIYD